MTAPPIDEDKALILHYCRIAAEKGAADTVLLKAYVKRAAELAATLKD